MADQPSQESTLQAVLEQLKASNAGDEEIKNETQEVVKAVRNKGQMLENIITGIKRMQLDKIVFLKDYWVILVGQRNFKNELQKPQKLRHLKLSILEKQK